MSSDALVLGLRPQTLRLQLTLGADFYVVLKLDEPWPSGTNLTLKLGSVTWAATIVGDEATFNVDKAQADTIPHGTEARLIYTNGTTDQTWAVGSVERQRNG